MFHGIYTPLGGGLVVISIRQVGHILTVELLRQLRIFTGYVLLSKVQTLSDMLKQFIFV